MSEICYENYVNANEIAKNIIRYEECTSVSDFILLFKRLGGKGLNTRGLQKTFDFWVNGFVFTVVYNSITDRLELS